MKIGIRFDNECANITSINGMVLLWVNEIRYVDVFIVCSIRFKCSMDHDKRFISLFEKVANSALEEIMLHVTNYSQL